MRLFRDVVVLGIIAGLIWCWFAVGAGTKVEATCGPTVTTPQIVQGMDRVGKLGDAVRKVIEVGKGIYEDDEPGHVLRTTIKIVDTIGLLRDVFGSHAAGKKEPSAATGIRVQTKRAQEKALASCCPAAPVTPTPPDVEEPPNDGGDKSNPPFDPRTLSVSLGSVTKEEGEAQTLAIAATAIAVGKQRGLGEQAWVIIIATGMQESAGNGWLLNLDHGDRDSVGWLQQRAPWGTVSQRMQPAYAAKKFYEALERVPGWETLPVTVAAQKVQRSAYPNAYAKWERPARELVARVGGDAVDPSIDDLDSVDTPAWCNPTTAERNSADTPLPGVGGSVAAFTTATAEARLINPRTPAQALAWLGQQKGNTAGQCLHYAAAAYGHYSTQPASPPFFNGGGQWGADEQWAMIPAKYKHSAAEPAPPGAVMWWRGGNKDGHVALSLGGQMVRSTGVGPNGTIGDKPLSYFDGYGEYLGWTLPYWPNRTKIGVSA